MLQRIQYKGHYRNLKLNRMKVDMETEGKAVRCIDCVDRKKCPTIRVNKYAKRPCKKFCIDLNKQAKTMEEKRKKIV